MNRLRSWLARSFATVASRLNPSFDGEAHRAVSCSILTGEMCNDGEAIVIAAFNAGKIRLVLEPMFALDVARGLSEAGHVAMEQLPLSEGGDL